MAIKRIIEDLDIFFRTLSEREIAGNKNTHIAVIDKYNPYIEAFIKKYAEAASYYGCIYNDGLSSYPTNAEKEAVLNMFDEDISICSSSDYALALSGLLPEIKLEAIGWITQGLMRCNNAAENEYTTDFPNAMSPFVEANTVMLCYAKRFNTLLKQIEKYLKSDNPLKLLYLGNITRVGFIFLYMLRLIGVDTVIIPPENNIFAKGEPSTNLLERLDIPNAEPLPNNLNLIYFENEEELRIRDQKIFLKPKHVVERQKKEKAEQEARLKQARENVARLKQEAEEKVQKLIRDMRAKRGE